MLKTVFILLVAIAFPSYSQEVNFVVSVKDSLNPISPFIYGTNQLLGGGENWGSHRQGGNRMTGYNWENNASNAGSDYFHQSDNYLTWISSIPSDSENNPGIVTTTFHNQSLQLNAYSLVTLQMAGYAAKDKSGPVTEAETAPSSRWVKINFKKDSDFSIQPNTLDTLVYMDEYVNFLVNRFGNAHSSTGIRGYSLDNEPSLWSSTHPRIHPLQTSCSEIVQKAVSLSQAVKEVDPYAEIYGPALYGFNAYLTFQSAPDWNQIKSGKDYTWFIDYYLDKMKEAEDSTGKRLLDVLDVHWYPEAIGDHRITGTDAISSADNLARVQGPRTLWDKKYTENSWIGIYFKSYLPLIPKLQNSINKYYPGTKLAFTEFSYGGENDISGGIAMADALGIFGKYGIYFSSFWQLNSSSDYVTAAYKIYRNYDGNNSTIGDYYLPSSTGDSVNCSIYGSIKVEANEIHLIVINKNFSKEIKGKFFISSPKDILSGRVWKLDKNSPEITEISGVDSINSNSFTYLLPAESVCHFVLTTSSFTGMSEKGIVPGKFNLRAYPNPFNPICKIEYSIPENSAAKIDIISTTGKLVRSFNGLSHSGFIYWNGKNGNNLNSSSGVYFAVLRSGDQILTQKLILLK